MGFNGPPPTVIARIITKLAPDEYYDAYTDTIIKKGWFDRLIERVTGKPLVTMGIPKPSRSSAAFLAERPTQPSEL